MVPLWNYPWHWQTPLRLLLCRAEQHSSMSWCCEPQCFTRLQWVSPGQSSSSSLMWASAWGCLLPLPSLCRMYSLNWDESTPPPHEHVIQKPLCWNRSKTCRRTNKRQNHGWDTNTPNERKVSAEASSTCTEFRRQQPLSGKRLMCVESREAERTSLTSGKTSSITVWCALTLTLSPSSGATWTTTHSGHDCPHSRSVLQCSSWDCKGVSWKKRASSYSKENSCRGTRTNTTFTAIRWEGLYHSLVLMAHPHAFTPPAVTHRAEETLTGTHQRHSQ